MDSNLAYYALDKPRRLRKNIYPYVMTVSTPSTPLMPKSHAEMINESNSTSTVHNQNIFTEALVETDIGIFEEESEIENPPTISDFGRMARAEVSSKKLPEFSYSVFLDSLHSKVNSVDITAVKDLFDIIFSKVTEDCVDFALSLLSLFYRLYRLESFTDLFFAALDFLKSMLGVSMIADSAKYVFSFLKENVTRLYNLLLVTPCGTESRAIDVLTDLRSRMNVILNSEIVTALRDFVLSLVTFKVFSKEASSKIVGTLGPAKPASACDFAEICLSTAISVLTFGDNLKSGSSLSDVFSHRDPVSAFISLTDELESIKELTYSGLPVEGKVCRREYFSRLIDCARDGESILTSLPSNAPQRRGVEFSLKKIRLTKAQFTNIMSAESRPMPYAVCIEGMPGVGKGLLVDYVSMVWSHVKQRGFSQSHVYHRQATEEYWSGYEPLSKPIIHYSEPGSLNRAIAAKSGDPVMTEFLSVCDNQPYMCNMADVDSKGKVFAMPEMLVMDCNDPTMNLDVLVNNPAAVKRRITYITPHVKPEFLQVGTCKIDQAKSLASETPRLDRWTFDVYRLEPINCKKSETVVLLKEASIYELSSFLNGDFERHILQQEQRVNILENVKISEYINAHTESMTLSHYVPNKFVFEYHYMCMVWYCFLEILLAAARTLYELAWLVCISFTGLLLWVYPQNFLLKVWSLRAWQGRLSYQQDRFDHSWNYFRATLGLSNNYTCKPVPDYKTAKYVASLAGLLLLVRSFKSFSFFTEGNVISSSQTWSEEQVDDEISRFENASGCRRPPPRVKRGNGIEWDNTSRPIPTPIDHQNQMKPSEEVVNAVTKNVRTLHITGEKVIETRVTGIMEDLAIINRHSVSSPDKNGLWRAVVMVDADQKVGVIKVTFDASEMCQIDGDLWLIRLRGCKFKDIRPYIAADHVDPALYGNRSVIAGFDVIAKSAQRIVAQDKNWGPVIVDRPLTYEWPTHAVGMCGSPLIMEYSGGRGLVGIHIAGTHTDTSFSQKIRLKDILSTIDKLGTTTCSLGVNSEGFLRLPKKVTAIGDISHHSPLRFEDVSGLAVMGGLVGYSAMKLGKSKLRSSEFIHMAEELTGVSPFSDDGLPHFGAPPFTSGLNPDGEYVAPYNHFVKKAGVVKESLDPIILRETIRVVTDHVVKELALNGVTSIRPVSMEVAQNGDPKDFYMRAMKPSTSGGWPWPGNKKKYSRSCCLPFKEDSYLPLYDVKEQVVEQLRAYERGEDALPLLGAQLKDEARARKKILERKTRVFCMSPYESTLVNRMYLMPFYTLMVEHGDVFRTAIGINMHSTDVDDLVHKMTTFSDYFMEGDYGGFDTSMPYDIGLAANTVVYQVCETLGYDDFALQMVKGILSDNLYPTVVMRGDVFAAPALQPSGKYATAEDNSLRGLILLVYAWISECTDFRACGSSDKKIFSPEEFFEYTLPVIYGDDVLVGVKPAAQDYFNNVTYQTFCETIYGLDYTNALKTKDMVPFLSWSQCSFLKRTFVFREDLDHWVAPLELKSIMKSIVYYLPSKSVSKEDQLIDSCVSALRELFFHLTEEEYHERRLIFATKIELLFERQASDILRLFPTFEDIISQLYGTDCTILL